MSAPVETLLSCLDGIHQTGRDRWIAKCPAHDDHSPSLSIRQTDDKLLVNCFAGCGIGDVLGSIGLTLADLYPDRPAESQGRKPQPDYKGLVLMLSREAWVVVCAASAMVEGREVSRADVNRLIHARQRLNLILEMADVRA